MTGWSKFLRKTGLVVLVLVAGACSDDDPAKLKATVQQSVTDSTGASCFTTIGGDALASDFPLKSCSVASPGTLASGVDRVRVVLDYGVELDDSQAAPTPTLTVTVDGAPAQVKVDTLTPVAGNSRFVLFEFPAPDGEQMRIEVSAAAGYTAKLSDVYELTPAPPPSLELVVTECIDMTTCTRSGGVGAVQAVVTLGSDEPQTVTLRSTLDGVSDGKPLDVPIDTPDGLRGLTGLASVPVPKAREGAAWSLVAQLGSVKSKPTSITIARPAITLTPICGNPCSVKVGKPLSVKVTAPIDFVDTQATLQTALDDIPAAPSTLNLDQKDIGGGLIYGQTTLTAPTTAGKLQLDANVGGYLAPTQFVTVAK